MIRHIKTVTIVSSVITLIVFSSNAVSEESNDYDIETVASNVAKISSVRLLKTSGKYVVKGKVRKKSRHRSTSIPGHVDISIIASNGKTVKTCPVPIYRTLEKSRTARFKKALKETPPTGSSIRVAHHNAPLRKKTTHDTHL